MNKIKVWLYKSSNPIIHKDSMSYQKGSLFCVYEPKKQTVFKYPIEHIWRIQENYPDSDREHKDE